MRKNPIQYRGVQSGRGNSSLSYPTFRQSQHCSQTPANQLPTDANRMNISSSIVLSQSLRHPVVASQNIMNRQGIVRAVSEAIVYSDNGAAGRGRQGSNDELVRRRVCIVQDRT